MEAPNTITKDERESIAAYLNRLEGAPVCECGRRGYLVPPMLVRFRGNSAPYVPAVCRGCGKTTMFLFEALKDAVRRFEAGED